MLCINYNDDKHQQLYRMKQPINIVADLHQFTEDGNLKLDAFPLLHIRKKCSRYVHRDHIFGNESSPL